MKSILLSLQDGQKESALLEGLHLLQAGKVIALPTDTVYGLAVDPLNQEAVQRLFTVKQRPPEVAIPLLLADATQLRQVVSAVPPVARRLAAAFWPGALTLILPARPVLPANLLAGGHSVAVRWPDAPAVHALANALGRPLAVTSANRSGCAPARTAGEVIAQLAGRIPLILDGGPTPGRTPSTIVDLTGHEPHLLRPGPIPWIEIQHVANEQEDPA